MNIGAVARNRDIARRLSGELTRHHPRQRRPTAVERPADIGFDVAPPCLGVNRPNGAECGEEARVVDKQADRAEIAPTGANVLSTAPRSTMTSG